jgi:hypothetical protein
MNTHEWRMVTILQRKLLTAILTSMLFAVIFSLPDGFEVNLFLNLYYLDLMFAITYGVIVSFASDWLCGKFISSTYAREIVSFLLHCLFGSVLLVFSLVTAVIFFILDRLLKKAEISWWIVIIALIINGFVFIINII